MKKQTNRSFSQENKHFLESVALANEVFTPDKELHNTQRQASKFRMGKGLAFQASKSKPKGGG